MPELSLPDETRVGEPLPIRLSGGPTMDEVSVRLTVTDDAGRELNAQTVYRTTTDGELDTTKANVVRGADIGDRLPLSQVRPEEEYQFPYAIFDESDQVSIAVSAKVDDELYRGDTTRTLVDSGVTTESVDIGEGVDAELFLPPGDGPHPGAVFLHGASGVESRRRIELLATAGVAMLVPDYLGSVPERELVEVPLSTIEEAVDLLANRDDSRTPVSLVGSSRGSEAAALVGASHDAVDTVVGYAPSAYAFPGLVDDDEGEPRSAWTRDGEPVAFVPVPDDLPDADDADSSSFTRFQHALVEATSDDLDAAALPWGEVDTVTVISGGHDTVWPATAFCERIAMWRKRADRETTHVDHPDAGHGVLEPYRDYRERVAGLGGSALGDAEAGIDAWPAVLDALRVDR
ncbi:acyl-CoA thioester hydrolase/BAAT C-terminal domain-containing protein [Haloarchaeobius sp. DT45]|uniref:acyl-CoA thioesterase/bile acid-CoA:amino acid N-acyltransferase family protein n=1 Tax=Haloarchaeobius sp. DT45 TaxID=3446116 RepID=UPI003F6B8F90